jgi:hypothetical protein
VIDQTRARRQCRCQGWYLSPGGSAGVSLAPVPEHRMASAGHTDCANLEAVRTARAKVTTLINQAKIVIRLKVSEAPSVARLTLRHPSSPFDSHSLCSHLHDETVFINYSVPLIS